MGLVIDWIIGLYNPYEWPHNWVAGVITPITEVRTLLITSRGPNPMRGFTCSRSLISRTYPLIISDERCGGMIEFRVICFQIDNRKIHRQNFKRYPVPNFGAYEQLSIFHSKYLPCRVCVIPKNPDPSLQ